MLVHVEIRQVQVVQPMLQNQFILADLWRLLNLGLLVLLFLRLERYFSTDLLPLSLALLLDQQ